MGLAETLVKLAIGVAVAQGVSTLVKAGASGGTAPGNADRPRGVEDIMDGIGEAGTGHCHDPNETKSGGIGDILDQLSGKKPAAPRNRTNAPKGGLDDLLTGNAQGAAAGGATFWAPSLAVQRVAP